jgi:hypothetical protein
VSSWDTLSEERAPGFYCRAGPYPFSLLLALIHRSAWKVIFAKSDQAGVLEPANVVARDARCVRECVQR